MSAIAINNNHSNYTDFQHTFDTFDNLLTWTATSSVTISRQKLETMLFHYPLTPLRPRPYDIDDSTLNLVRIYDAALATPHLTTLAAQHTTSLKRFGLKLLNNPRHHDLLPPNAPPPRRVQQNSNKLVPIPAHTDRYHRSAVPTLLTPLMSYIATFIIFIVSVDILNYNFTQFYH